MRDGTVARRPRRITEKIQHAEGQTRVAGGIAGTDPQSIDPPALLAPSPAISPAVSQTAMRLSQIASKLTDQEVEGLAMLGEYLASIDDSKQRGREAGWLIKQARTLQGEQLRSRLPKRVHANKRRVEQPA